MHVLVIKRIEREDDPWSGHLALPGGYRHRGENLIQTAIRESGEEVGITPEISGYLGSYSTYRGEKRVGVFFSIVDGEPAHEKGPEVAYVHWVALGDLKPGKTRMMFPSLDFAGGQIWGLTYRILSDNLREIK